MKNVSFIKRDGWLGNDLIARVAGLDMDARNITVSNKTVDVTDLVLTDPYVSLLGYTGKYVAAPNPEQLKEEVKKAAQEWNIAFGNVTIRNGRFRNDVGNYTANSPHFDGQHVDFSSINGSLKNIGWTADTISGRIDLAMKERSGLVVKSLKANTTFHPRAMIFDDFLLETNRSVIRDYFSMKYEDIGKLDNFIHDVTMVANFKDATISSEDIAFFCTGPEDLEEEYQDPG